MTDTATVPGPVPTEPVFARGHPRGVPAGKSREGLRETGVPPLRDGDRMDADEFLRRWEAMPEPRPRAELLDGRVCWIQPMAITEDLHGVPQAWIVMLLGWYAMSTPGTLVSGAATLRQRPRQMPEPDAYLRIHESHGGQSRRAPDGFVDGAAELVVEVAGSSAGRDLGQKFDIYRRMGVVEYVVWRTDGAGFQWFARRGDRFDPMPAGGDGVLRSEAFPGLWIDEPALRAGDIRRAMETMQHGTASPEHAAFVARLAEAATTAGREADR